MRRRQAKKNLKREIAAIITPMLRDFARAISGALMSGRRPRAVAYPAVGRRSGKSYVAALLTKAAQLGARRSRANSMSVRDRCLKVLAALGYVGLDGLRTWQLIRIAQQIATV